MPLKVKDGVELLPWGPNFGKVTSATSVSQEYLAVLKERYPDEVEGELELSDEAPAEAEQTEKPKKKK